MLHGDCGAGGLDIAHRESELFSQKAKTLSSQKHFVLLSRVSNSERVPAAPCSDFVTKKVLFILRKNKNFARFMPCAHTSANCANKGVFYVFERLLTTTCKLNIHRCWT